MPLACESRKSAPCCGGKLHARGDAGQITVFGKNGRTRAISLPAGVWDDGPRWQQVAREYCYQGIAATRRSFRVIEGLVPDLLYLSVMKSRPDIFVPHPNLDDRINRNICQSELEGGVLLDHLPFGSFLEIETCDWTCYMVAHQDGQAVVWGHELFCPLPVLVDVFGSTWGGSMMKVRYIGRGMRMEF